MVFESAVPSEPVVQWRIATAMRECAVLLAAEIRLVGVASPWADTYAWGLIGASHNMIEAGIPVSPIPRELWELGL